MKKIAILIIILCSVVSVGIMIFVVMNKSKTVYAKSITLSSRAHSMVINTQLEIKDIDVLIQPSNCNQKFEYIFDASYLSKTDNSFRAIRIGETELIIKVRSSENIYIQDSLLINITEDSQQSTISFSVDSLEMTRSETKSIASIFSIVNNTTDDATITYSNSDIVTMMLKTKYLQANAIGTTVITVSLQTPYGKISDSLSVSVVEPRYVDYSFIVTPSSINKSFDGYNISIVYQILDEHEELASNQACTVEIINGDEVIDIVMHGSGNIILRPLAIGTAKIRISSTEYEIYIDVPMTLN